MVSEPLQSLSPHVTGGATHCWLWQILLLFEQLVHDPPLLPHELSEVPKLQAEPLQQPEHAPQSPGQLHLVSEPLQSPSPHFGGSATHCWPSQTSAFAEQFMHASAYSPQAELLSPVSHVAPLQQPLHAPQSCGQLHLVSLPLHWPSPQSAVQKPFEQTSPPEQLAHWAPFLPQAESAVPGLQSLPTQHPSQVLEQIGS